MKTQKAIFFTASLWCFIITLSAIYNYEPHQVAFFSMFTGICLFSGLTHE